MLSVYSPTGIKPGRQHFKKRKDSMVKILEQKPQPKTLMERFKDAVRFFHAQTGMEFTAIGYQSIKNPRVWARLENGGEITLGIADQVYAWMAEQGFHFNSEGDCYVEERPEGQEIGRRKESSRQGKQGSSEE